MSVTLLEEFGISKWWGVPNSGYHQDIPDPIVTYQKKKIPDPIVTTSPIYK